MEGSEGNAETYVLAVNDKWETTTTRRRRLPEVREAWGSVLNKRA